MKRRICKKRISKRLKQFKWQLNYIKGHHLRHTLISKSILFKYRWRKYTDSEKQLFGINGCSSKNIEKKRLNKLWNV